MGSCSSELHSVYKTGATRGSTVCFVDDEESANFTEMPRVEGISLRAMRRP
jgi:hypothetical protein